MLSDLYLYSVVPGNSIAEMLAANPSVQVLTVFQSAPAATFTGCSPPKLAKLASWPGRWDRRSQQCGARHRSASRSGDDHLVNYGAVGPPRCWQCSASGLFWCRKTGRLRPGINAIARGVRQPLLIQRVQATRRHGERGGLAAMQRPGTRAMQRSRQDKPRRPRRSKRAWSNRSSQRARLSTATSSTEPLKTRLPAGTRTVIANQRRAMKSCSG